VRALSFSLACARCSTAAFLALIVITYGCLAQESSIQGAQIPVAQAAPFAGCYELKLGRWWPWGMGGDTKFATPSRRIELTLERGTKTFERQGLFIRAIPPDTTLSRNAWWVPLPGDRVDLFWTNGFAGAALRLAKRGDDLHGWAHAFFDTLRPPHIAHVAARRVACPAGPE
jgi:hypothetical protein